MNSVLQNPCYLAKFNVARRYLCESQGMAGYTEGPKNVEENARMSTIGFRAVSFSHHSFLHII